MMNLVFLFFCFHAAEEGGLKEAMSFLKQVHEAYPDLMHECYNAHCTYGVVKRVVVEKQVRVCGLGRHVCPASRH